MSKLSAALGSSRSRGFIQIELDQKAGCRIWHLKTHVLSGYSPGHISSLFFFFSFLFITNQWENKPGLLMPFIKNILWRKKKVALKFFLKVSLMEFGNSPDVPGILYLLSIPILWQRQWELLTLH